MPPDRRVAGRSAEETRAQIESFLQNCRQPALLEPGEELIPLAGNQFALGFRGPRLMLEAWDRTRNLARQVTGIRNVSAGRLELTVEKFGRREGQLFLLDLARKAGEETGRRSGRLVFRERFRLFLRRQFPEWKLAEISADANLEYSLSPAFPRAFLRYGQHGWAAIACPPEADDGALLSFGLIWLNYLRARERRVQVEGLAVYLPSGATQATALRVLCLDPAAARWELFAYSPEDDLERVDPGDHGNLDTRLELCRTDGGHLGTAWDRLLALPGVEVIAKHDGRASVRMRGLELAEIGGEETPGNRLNEIERLAEECEAMRSPGAADRDHPLYRRYPEAWLESQVRSQIETVDATLLPYPVYGQVPAFAGGQRGILDLLAVDRAGRLAILELKASADPHLPLQALDYWVRVKWHLDRGEFTARGYFGGIALRPEAPRLLLVSPCLDFHPTTEAILGYFSPAVEVERIGLGVEWRKGLEVMFRLRGAERPH